ncbi:MAG: prephenate dehydrogenase/arogenate dehydrogenase family protein, partial [Oscillospiraceae bacterium]|nr:prephenate dehydrogenase/arogenate dehydrogenase family protein [Oscillospiraceae bacterium]
MKIGICGLGLIGGSLAKAFKRANETVFGYDINAAVSDYAVMAGITDGTLNDETIKECDYIFVALYPQAVVNYVNEISAKVKKAAVVVDLCGTKATVCPPCFRLAEENGFHFVGGHPMAGTQFSGLKNSKETLFDGATMILVPKENEDMHLLADLRDVLLKAGFGTVTVSTAQVHDVNIAYTSQLAHVVSNAYVKSPRSKVHKGFSAGSYKDLTRVAWLNENMWTELFLENSENLVTEIDLM